LAPYVIEHRDGLVLFDTGQDRASVTDPAYFPGGLTGMLYDRLARFDIGAQQTLTAGLGRLGYAASDVKTAVISHLHQDHIGGLAELSGADIMVSQAEWDTLSRPLEAGHVPGVGNRRHLRQATAMVNQMRQRYPDLAVLPAHDPGAADRLAQATGQAPTLASA
jgi:glyoxylase-like metal-dependent hydrolase (beta-lactamase superfamily II)